MLTALLVSKLNKLAVHKLISRSGWGVGLELVDLVQAGSERLIDLARSVDENIRVEPSGRQGFRPVIVGAEYDRFAPVVRPERGLDA